MEYSHDFQGLGFGIVDDEVVRERRHQPERHREGGQVLANCPGPRRNGEKLAGIVDGLLHAVCGCRVVLRDLFPNVEEVVYCVGCQPIMLHALLLSASHVRFFWSIASRTSSESINSPRFAAA